MITIISPAKNMKVVKRDNVSLSRTMFQDKTKQIIEKLKKYQPYELETLMKVNEKLAVQAFLDIQNFDLNKEGTMAILAYDGLVFKNIGAENFSIEELEYVNNHLRILSACYGCVKPLDEILPYRLEMQCKLKLNDKSLYQFWGELLYNEVYKENQIVLNLASEEYAKTIRKYAKQDQFIDVEFLTYHKGKLRTITTSAKMARGQMVKFIVENRIDHPEQIKGFDWNDYEFEESMSNEKKYVFIQR
ncbi:peroxide stress protein YaaA [Faecalimonas sp.]